MLPIRYVLVGGLLALVAIGGYWILQPRAILVEVAPVLEEHFTAVVEEDGRTPYAIVSWSPRHWRAACRARLYAPETR